MTKYWFRKRRGLFSGDLGWGWVPISVEGWLLTIALIVGLYFFIAVYKAVNLTDNIGLRQWIFGALTVLVFAFIADMKTQDKVLFK